MVDKTTQTRIRQQAIDAVSSWPGIVRSRLDGQIEILDKVIEAHNNNVQTVIIEAPTGFGKSILAMLIIEYFKRLDLPEKPGGINNTAYILTSNIMLQHQYDNDLVKFNLTCKVKPTEAKSSGYAFLKGQSNYECHVDHVPFNHRQKCKKTSIGKLMSFGKCGKDCEYVNARMSAIQSDCAVFNYNYWLTTMNFVYSTALEPPFKPRPVTVPDECHTMQNIVQNMFATELKPNYLTSKFTAYMQTLIFRYGSTRFFDGDMSSEEAIKKMDAQIAKFSLYCTALIKLSNVDDDASLKRILIVLRELKAIVSRMHSPIMEIIETKFPKDESDYSDTEEQIAKFAGSVNELVNKLGLLISIYNESGYDTIVLTYDADNDTLLFRCLDEAALIQRHFMSYTDFTLMMSATIGDIDKYAKTHGITDYLPIYVESNFSFDKSPIISVVPELKMSYANKKKNMPVMLERIYQILEERHPDESGIIHTGNYEFMFKLQEFMSRTKFANRIMYCRNAKQKVEAVRRLKDDSNLIIAGPGLIEGIDLKDDMARFMIFMKVPYPSLGDKFIRRKIDRYPDWYNWRTMCDFMQALGRPIRHKDDWCTTYLLDGSFGSFFHRYGKLPDIISTRLTSMNLDKGVTADQEINDFLETM